MWQSGLKTGRVTGERRVQEEGAGEGTGKGDEASLWGSPSKVDVPGGS